MESRVEVVAFEECQSLAGWVKWLVGGILSLQVVTFGLVGGLSEESRTAAVLGSGIALVVALVLVIALTGMRMRTVVGGGCDPGEDVSVAEHADPDRGCGGGEGAEVQPDRRVRRLGIRRGWSSGWGVQHAR
jgi:hypothetical protein